jgi:predicted nucleic acid-binding protein
VPLIKLLVDEPGAEEARSAYSEADGIRTTAIAHLEATAALARMRKGRRLTPTQLNRALEDLESIWRGIFSHVVNDALLAKAAESARTDSLRAYDAVHLSGALSFATGENSTSRAGTKSCARRRRNTASHWFGSTSNRSGEPSSVRLKGRRALASEAPFQRCCDQNEA